MRALALVFCLATLIRGEEIILRRAAIPNRLLRQGDALLVETADKTRFVRIELQTRHLARIEANIIESERRNWPDSPDSAAYVSALRAACAEALRDARGPVSFRIDWSERGVTLAHSGQVQVLEGLAPEYLRENLVLILMDRFGASREEAGEMLTP